MLIHLKGTPNLKQTAVEAVPLLLEGLGVFPQGQHTEVDVTVVCGVRLHPKLAAELGSSITGFVGMKKYIIKGITEA